MTRLSTLTGLAFAASLLLAAASCNCNSDTNSEDEATPSRTAVTSTQKTPAASPLAGSWSGSAIVPGQGPVAAGITIDDRGRGTAVLTARGLALTETFRIDSFGGRAVEATHRGTHYSLTAELDGSTLYIDLPVIGWITLRRSR